MILKGSQRGGARNFADHLMNDRDNDHISLMELRGFIAGNLRGALAEAYAISKGTKCDQFMFSLSLSPPKEAEVGEQDLLDAVDRAEKKLGLTDQPRAVIFHEKEGRRHAHVVWSRIDAQSMKAINLPHFKNRLMSLSRELYLEHGWELPDGLRRDGGKSPLNFSLAEWQQAKRLGLDPREIKQSFQDAWNQSDDTKSFSAALEDKGYFLSRGDRRGFVALDVKGEVFSVPRMLGIKTKEVKERLGDPQSLRSVDQTKAVIKERVSDKIHDFIDEVDEKHSTDMQPLTDQRLAMVGTHRIERAKLKQGQKQRWREEQKVRNAKLQKGIKGLWDFVSGRSKAVKAENEKEAWQAIKRDQAQRDDLVFAQMKERKKLQKDIEKLRRKHAQNRRILARDMMQAARSNEQAERLQSQQRQHSINQYRGPSL